MSLSHLRLIFENGASLPDREKQDTMKLQGVMRKLGGAVSMGMDLDK